MVTTIMVYKFEQLSRAEVQSMQCFIEHVNLSYTESDKIKVKGSDYGNPD
ncbi:hypothetical protein [Fortiea contorta]